MDIQRVEWTVTIYLRAASAAELVGTLDDLGAVRVGQRSTESTMSLPARDGGPISVLVVGDLHGWEIELRIESLEEWRAPFAESGWEPTVAAILSGCCAPDARKQRRVSSRRSSSGTTGSRGTG